MRGREDKYQDYLFFLAYTSQRLVNAVVIWSLSPSAGLSGIKIRRTFPGTQAHAKSTSVFRVSHLHKKIR